MKRGIRYDFSLLALLLIPVGVSLSVVGYQLSTILKFPIFIDQIGTVFVSMLGGPWVGLVTGLMGNVVNGMLNPVSFAYAFTSMSIGLVSGFLSRWKWYTNIIGTIAACLVLNVISATVSAMVTIFVFGGVTGAGTDLVTAAFLAAGSAMVQSVLSTNLLTGMAAMIIDVGVSWIILRRLPDRFLVKLNYGMHYVRNRKAIA